MKVLRALLLVLALSVCASAGEMPFGKDGNIPCGIAGEMETDKTGNIPYDKTGEMPNNVAGETDHDKVSPTDVTTAIALQFLQSLLPLF